MDPNRREEPQNTEDYVALGLAQNPRIAEANHRLNALRFQVPQVASLPDPTVSTTTHLSPIQTAAGEQRFGLGINQKFVRADRRATRAQIACAEVEKAEADLRDLELEIAESVRDACYQLMFVRQAIQITSDDSESLKRIETVIQRQYEVKKSVTQQDVLNVQVEQSQVENRLAKLRQQEASARARLARLLNLEPQSALPLSPLPTPNSNQLDAEALVEQAIAARPDLQAQLSAIHRDRRKIRLAQLEQLPDFQVGLNWIATSDQGISPVANGDDALLLGIGFNLPVRQRRIRAGICQARENAMASSMKLESLENQAAEEIFDLVSRVESTSEMLNLVRQDIIPKADRTLRLSIEDYQNGKVEYTQLIGNWRALLSHRLTQKRLESELHRVLAALNRAVGNSNAPTDLSAAAPRPQPIDVGQ